MSMSEIPTKDRTPSKTWGRWIAERPGAAIWLSWDLWLALPIGVAAGVTVGSSDAIRDSAQGVMMGLLAAVGALLGIVLAVITFQQAMFRPAFRELVSRVPGGVAGTLKPAVQVAWIAVGALLVNGATALSWPALLERPVPAGFMSGAGVFLSVYAVFGTLQAVQLLLQLARQQDQHERNIQEIDELKSRIARMSG